MCPIDLTASIENLGDYSAGAFKSDYMKPWALLPSTNDTPLSRSTSRHSLAITWGECGWKTSVSFAIYADETGAIARPPQTVFLRLLCHLLVDAMAEQGLQEAGDYLKDMLDFYQPSPSPLTLPSPHIVAAEHGETYERPNFLFLEE